MPGVSASPSPVAAVTGLEASQPQSWHTEPTSWLVTLSWTAPEGETQLSGYTIVRNGKPIASGVTATTYEDANVEPGITYHYSVLARGADGGESQPVSVNLKTHKPSLANARLDGRFIVRMHVVSQRHLTGKVQALPAQFNFVPTCGSGACGVKWSAKGERGSGRLPKRRAAYAGTVRSTFRISSCHGGSVFETLVIHLHVTAAKVLHHEWRASKLEGTLSESASSPGCLTGHIDWSYAGTVIG